MPLVQNKIKMQQQLFLLVVVMVPPTPAYSLKLGRGMGAQVIEVLRCLS